MSRLERVSNGTERGKKPVEGREAVELPRVLRISETDPTKRSFLAEVAKKCASPMEIKFTATEGRQHVFPSREDAEPLTTTEAASTLIHAGIAKMVDTLGTNGWNEETRRALGLPEGSRAPLREIIDMPRLQRELSEVRRNGDPIAIDLKEQEAAAIIQYVVYSIPGKEGSVTPEQVINTQQVNCASGTAIQSQFLKELDIDHVVGTIDGHTVSIRTGEKEFHWNDSQDPQYNTTLTSVDIQGVRGKTVTARDLAALATDPAHEELVVSGTTERATRHIRLGLRHADDPTNWLIFTNPKQGNTANMLEHIGNQLEQSGQTEASLLAYQYEQTANPNNFYPYYKQVKLLVAARRLDEALTVADQWTQLETSEVSYGGCWNNLACVLNKMGRYEEAIAAEEKAIAIWDNPDSQRNLNMFQRNLENSI